MVFFPDEIWKFIKGISQSNFFMYKRCRHICKLLFGHGYWTHIYCNLSESIIGFTLPSWMSSKLKPNERYVHIATNDQTAYYKITQIKTGIDRKYATIHFNFSELIELDGAPNEVTEIQLCFAERSWFNPQTFVATRHLKIRSGLGGIAYLPDPL